MVHEHSVTGPRRVVAAQHQREHETSDQRAGDGDAAPGAPRLVKPITASSRIGMAPVIVVVRRRREPDIVAGTDVTDSRNRTEGRREGSMRMLFTRVYPGRARIYDRPLRDAGAAGGWACPD
jgi:hypothetical protein